MRTLLPALLAVVVAATLAASDRPAPLARPATLNGHTFTLPAGFSVEVAARSPLVDRPIVADFDEQGRLYVADSSGSNDKVTEQLKTRPHRIVRLVDSNGDGVFDRQTVFADRMMFPEGVMWLDGSLYVAAPPSIWKLTDADGDGVAERREEWFQGKTLTGCANDLHGPYAGPDGWIYWCKGAFAEQRYPRPGRPDLVTKASHLFRCRPDGSGLEAVMTGGMDNPVDVTFTPAGERIFTTTFFQHPAGGKRDGLIHAVYGGIYGKDHAVIHDHPWTSPALMPVLTHMGPAAPAGLTRYESAAFGDAYRDNLFAAQFNMQKVSRHVLRVDGAGFSCRDSDFLVSDNRDFHPTDVIEDADGSLLVVDTGGWYKLCCPTSQLGKPDILGAVYRVRRNGVQVSDPRGRSIDWAKQTPAALAGLLGDPRPAVARRAVATLAARGAAALPALTDTLRAGSERARLNAVWTATRLAGPEARAAVRRALADRDETVRQAALHAVSLWRDRAALPELRRLLQGDSLHGRRVAAEAIGRIGEAAAVPELLKAIAANTDRVLDHSLTYALIEIGDAAAIRPGLTAASPRVRRSVLAALAALPGQPLAAETVAAELNAADAALRETAWWIAGRQPAWGATLARAFASRLAEPTLTPAQRDELVGQLGRFAKDNAIGRLLAERLRLSRSAGEQMLVLRAMAASGVKPAPADWIEALTAVLAGARDELQREALITVRALPIEPRQAEKLAPRLHALAGDARQEAEARLRALAALPGGPGALKADLFALVTTNLDREGPVVSRGLAVDVLLRARLPREQLLALCDTLKTAGPMELDRLLDVFARTADEAVGSRLLAALRTAPARGALRVDGVRTRLAKYPPTVLKQAEALYAELDAELLAQRARLEKLAGSLRPGDVRRGQAVFNSQKAACASCHAIGYLGGKVGPDLTRIGGIRSERDLLEAILYPSASFVRSYEPVLVTTASGKVHNGLVKQEAADAVILTTTATEEVRLPRGDIDEMQPSKVSIMPAGLDKVLTEQELADLVAFLKAAR